MAAGNETGQALHKNGLRLSTEKGAVHRGGPRRCGIACCVRESVCAGRGPGQYDVVREIVGETLPGSRLGETPWLCRGRNWLDGRHSSLARVCAYRAVAAARVSPPARVLGSTPVTETVASTTESERLNAFSIWNASARKSIRYYNRISVESRQRYCGGDVVTRTYWDVKLAALPASGCMFCLQESGRLSFY